MNVSDLLADDVGHIGYAGAHTYECGDLDQAGCDGVHAAPSIRMRATILTGKGRNKKPGTGRGIIGRGILLFQVRILELTGGVMATKERSFSIRDLITALLRDQNIHTGSWGLTMHFTANGTSITEVGGAKLPGLAVAVSGVTLVPTAEGEHGSIDASLVNPAKEARVRSLVRPKALH